MTGVFSSWHTFFATEAGVGATLTGLLFVALSINLKDIVRMPGLAGRAGEALLVLLLPVFVGLAGLLPQTSLPALGAELLVLGLIELTGVNLIVAAGHGAGKERPRREYVLRVVTAEVAVLPTAVAGIVLLAHHPGGLWWQAAGTGLCITTGVVDAWVLLVEILR